jgi:hypothetical protein
MSSPSQDIKDHRPRRAATGNNTFRYYGTAKLPVSIDEDEDEVYSQSESSSSEDEVF